MSRPNEKEIATIHAHVHIMARTDKTETGSITLEEQIKALQRHVAWHRRQVETGEYMLTRLKQQADQVSEKAAS